MKQIVISEFMDATAVQSLRSQFDVLYDPTLVDDPAALRAAAASADALIVRNRTQVRGDLLAAFGHVSVVGRLGVGLDNIDVDACIARGVRVIPATGANAQAVAEYVVAAAMVLLRGVFHAADAVASGQWPRASLSEGREVGGKTLGLIGFGGIGQLTARLARGMGMQVLAHDPLMPPGHPVWAQAAATPVALEALLAQAEVVSLHVPLIAQTRYLLDASRIAQMKQGAVVINTSRGGVLDEAALTAALRSGALAGAAIDVFEAEPLPAGSIWTGCPNVILTPHVAGVTAEANLRVSTLIAAEVARHLKGRS
ncbi:NAD(P)-dependent oxidoreductase [Variovorax sp. OV329]|uniref:NAD(P)-dependent oxidoreductase n=1 Tax=Variovorax sp. OV329 TaxID=1882825 RepID=UPI0008DEFEDB|nr:NAD(P)-dependent oxidoreductase [Variovorax sp. OV329]SFN52113.1 (S)-sulfolactate dehydrogenase [Variovorax sp. OV329]